MAQLYSTGPAHVFVGPGTGVSPGISTIPALYLGTCEVSPQIEIAPHFEAVHNDLGGVVPFDEIYEGEEAFIDLDLNRFNEVTYATIAARPSGFTAGPARGANTAADVGTLMLTEGKNLILWVVFPFFAKAVMRAGGMPAGYRFPACTLKGPDRLSPVGTRARKIHLLFHALRTWSPTTGAFLLYDHSVSGLPPIN